MNYLSALNWRYAAKRMNGHAVASEKLDRILESIRLAPTSYGMQPFKVFVIQNEELKKTLQPACYHQPQITECGTLLVFLAWKEVSDAMVNDYIQALLEERKMPFEKLEAYKQAILGSLSGKRSVEGGILNWASRQTYIALGTALFACALEEIDSTPIEGFEPEKVNQILSSIKPAIMQNHYPSLIMTLGHRDPSDANSQFKKYRKKKEEIFEWL